MFFSFILQLVIVFFSEACEGKNQCVISYKVLGREKETEI